MNPFLEVMQNHVLFVVFFAWIFSCILKGLITWAKDGKLDKTRFLGPGGMPSSHSTIVTCLAVSVGFQDGFDSTLFVACCVLALVVMYDASGIRRAAGQHAKFINMIMDLVQESDPQVKQDRLKELLGHSPLEVTAGAFLGVLIAVIAAAFGIP